MYRMYIRSFFIGLVTSSAVSFGVSYYLNPPPQPTYEELAWRHVRDHCGFPAHIDAWVTCGARESNKFREQQIQLAVNAWPNI